MILEGRSKIRDKRLDLLLFCVGIVSEAKDPFFYL